MYTVLAVVNLAFYYTSKMNNQNYSVRRTINNQIFSYSFRSMTVFILWLYISYICLFLIWWVLGAIINPEKFLPYATTSISFISYIVYKYNNIREFYKELEKVVIGEVTKQMVKLQKKVTKGIFNTESSADDDGDEEDISTLVRRSGRELFLLTFVKAFGKDVT